MREEEKEEAAAAHVEDPTMAGAEKTIEGNRGEDEGPLPPFARPLKTRPTSWDPSNVEVALNVTLDACFVPTSSGTSGSAAEVVPGYGPKGCRVALSHVVALDGVVDEGMRRGLFERVTAPGWDDASPTPPTYRWERRTADLYDDDGGTGEATISASGGDGDGDGDGTHDHSPAPPPPPTWGLTDSAMRDLEDDAAVSDWAFLELHARLCELYPEYVISHMPAESLRAPPPKPKRCGDDGDGDVGDDGNESSRRGPPLREHHHRCDSFVANAAVHGDGFRWHVDADPSCFPGDCPWTAVHGDYFNGEPGKPLFVSALVYLNDKWPSSWDAETLFLDKTSGVGVLVRPRPGRLILMDQDVTHRVSPPSSGARRPRYSLVWKLVFFPKKKMKMKKKKIDQTTSTGGGGDDERGRRGDGGNETDTETETETARGEEGLRIARPEWGVPSPIGSAAKLAGIMAAMRRFGDLSNIHKEGEGGEEDIHRSKKQKMAFQRE